MEKEYFSVNELAEYTGFAEQTIYHWIAKRKIPFYKFGKTIKFSKPEIFEWINRHKVKTAFDFPMKF